MVPKLILVLNHVISSEESAMSRLRPHAGRYLRLECHGPAGFPAWPAVLVEITPAGLFDTAGLSETASPDLHIVIDASNPLALALGGLKGERPRMAVSGDATLAGDIHWLIENLRWDIEDDLSRLIGPMGAHQVLRWGSWWASGLRDAITRLMALAGRWSPGKPSA
jgi:ubiquinone biosynthesis protein UbiJ